MPKFLANSIDHRTASRRWFASLLWRAFPAASEHDLSLDAARVLGVSPRQVRNWLRCDHDAGLSTVLAVLAIAGAEIVFDRMEARR
jgi:acyl-CoA synthetase (AMP-forming)/AMP-acid ligase II